MTTEPERARWLALAARIADGDPIAWDAEGVEHEPDRELLGALQLLDIIASAKRRIQETASLDLAQWGHLTILEPVATGASWVRCRAADPGLGEMTLLLAGPLDGDPTAVERLLRHARAQTRLHHPNLPTVYGADYAQDRVGVWSEWNAGQTLEQIVPAHGPLGASEAATIVCALAGAVDAFHQAGLVHGAVAPGSVTRSPDGRVVLAVSLLPPLPRDFHLAPEILAGAPPAPTSDVYGMGLTLHYLATGRYPSRSSAAQDAPRLTSGVPRALAPILDRALAVDPAGRYATVAEFEAAVRRAIRREGPGRDWMIGFAIAALVVGLMLLLAWLNA